MLVYFVLVFNFIRFFFFFFLIPDVSRPRCLVLANRVPALVSAAQRPGGTAEVFN